MRISQFMKPSKDRKPKTVRDGAELETLFGQVKPGRYSALAMTSLEQSVMWIVKELTS